MTIQNTFYKEKNMNQNQTHSPIKDNHVGERYKFNHPEYGFDFTVIGEEPRSVWILSFVDKEPRIFKTKKSSLNNCEFLGRVDKKVRYQ